MREALSERDEIGELGMCLGSFYGCNAIHAFSVDIRNILEGFLGRTEKVVEGHHETRLTVGTRGVNYSSARPVIRFMRRVDHKS